MTIVSSSGRRRLVARRCGCRSCGSSDRRPASPSDPAGHVRDATSLWSTGWVEDGLQGRQADRSIGDETWVEIEVRGDFILDCNGQPVDANAVGLTPAPTGNGTPGGTFLSTLPREPRRPRLHRRAYAN